MALPPSTTDWMDKIPEAARSYVAGRRLDEVECIVSDIAGVARGKAMPASKFARQPSFYLPNSIFLQTITGDWADNPSGAFTEPDMVLTPDFSTTSAAPWTADVTLQVIHDVNDQQGRPVQAAPRNVLKRIVALYNAQGWSPIVAPEMEFFLVARNTDPNKPIIPPMGRSGRRAAAKQAYSMSAVDEYGKVIDDIYDFAEAQGFEIDGILQEGGAGQVQREGRAEAGRPVLAAHGGGPADGEVDDRAAGIVLAPQVCMRVVGVEDGDAAVGEPVENLALGAGDRLDRAEEADVRGQRVVDERDVGARQPRQVVDLAGVVHAHLEHGEAVRRAQAQQHQRQADVVVEVAFGGEHRVITAGLDAQDRRQHFLDRGLAVAAGHRDQRNREVRAPGGGEPAEREAGVVDPKRVADFGRLRAIEHDAGGALLQRLRAEGAAVEFFAAQRNEQVARADRAAVGRHPQHLCIGAGERDAEHRRGFG
jgi:hypothetical protein